MADPSSQQLLDLWRRQLQEGTEAWQRLVGQGQMMDLQAFWSPFMDQGIAAWWKVMTQGPASPELMTQWKQFQDQWIAAWSKAFEQAMGTEAFARVLGKQLEVFLDAASPMKKAAEQHIEAMLAGLGVPSRSQVVGIARQMVALEEKIEAVEDRVDAVLKRLNEVAQSLKQERP